MDLDLGPYMLPPLEPDTAREYWISQLRSNPNTQLGILYDMKVGFDPKNGTIKQHSKKTGKPIM